MSSQMIIRLDGELKQQLARVATAEGKTISGVVRELVRAYVRERDLGAYIDGLWDRIGSRMNDAGYDLDDVDRVIREVREQPK